jgi:hypothetical protein
MTADMVSASSEFWMSSITRQGVVPFGTDASYKIFRNVQDYGAKGGEVLS